MSRTVASLPAGSRITDYISLGVVAKTFPLEKIRASLAASGKESVRQRDLPAHVVVYYVIALALYTVACVPHAVVVSGSAALSAGRNPVAGGTRGGNQCGW
jgi:hypothetical protein